MAGMKILIPSAPPLDGEATRVGATIRALREMRGLTQEQLARRARLSRPFLGNVECGRKRLSARAAARVADALVVPQTAILAPAPADPDQTREG